MKGTTNAQNGMTKIVGPTKADLQSIPDGTFWRLRYKDSQREFFFQGYGTPIVPSNSYKPVSGAYGGSGTGYSASAWPVFWAFQDSDTTELTIALKGGSNPTNIFAAVKYTDIERYATLYLYGGGGL